MELPVHHARYTFADYLAFERTSNVKHEYLAGQIFAMAGGTPEHAALAAAVNGLLFAQLRDSPCRTYSSDLRVRAGDLVTYPDVTVICGVLARDPQDKDTALNSKVVVEVTSPSSSDYDRGEKLEHFQGVPSLAVVLIVAHEERRLELWVREELRWRLQRAGPGGRVELAAIGCSLGVDEVYAGVAV
jgi:Uma2 family endonuclease